ncbi:MAG: hypothetical protein AB1374_02020 [Bacillota bacterium]
MRRSYFFVSVLISILLIIPLIPPLISVSSETLVARFDNVRLSTAPGILPEAIDAALSEINRLSKKLPPIFDEKWHIRLAGPCRQSRDGSLVTGFCFPARGTAVILAPCGGMLGPILAPDPSSGRTLTLQPAEPAVPCYVAATVSHEVGHLVRFEFFPPDEFQQYLRVRNWQCDTDPEELFAEDFRWLFGSELAKDVPFQANGVALPGEKERKFILRNVGHKLRNP